MKRKGFSTGLLIALGVVLLMLPAHEGAGAAEAVVGKPAPVFSVTDRRLLDPPLSMCQSSSNRMR